jgi:DNA-binding MarR family transcriptional regulator
MTKQELALIFELFTEVGIISQLSNALLEKQLPLDLKASQFALLNHFARVGDGATHAELASTMQVTKAAMTNTLSRLATHDLIRIEPDQIDGRVKRVFVTKKGTSIRKKSIKQIFNSMSELQDKIDIKEFERTLPFLAELRTILDSAR